MSWKLPYLQLTTSRVASAYQPVLNGLLLFSEPCSSCELLVYTYEVKLLNILSSCSRRCVQNEHNYYKYHNNSIY